MRIIESVGEMQQQTEQWRSEGKRVALVPTMGYLHEGHLSLMREARHRADVVVMSVFVNPTQFGPNEDFERYPRDLNRDVALAEGAGVDVAFAPPVPEMYPEGYKTYVEVKDITAPLCGKSRPVHFQGVATVVAKLFIVVRPHVAVFGQKDFQQLVTIRRLNRDLHLGVEVIGHPTVREADGLAMSSRNVYLTPEQRVSALGLSQSLGEAQSLVDAGERDAAVILARVRQIMESGGGVRIDYAELRHPESMEEVTRIEGPTLLALAAYLGVTRIIDNRVLQLPS